MARPGFVLTVDDRTPPLLVAEGGGLRLQTFPRGTEVVYPSDTSGRRVDADAAVAAALADALDTDPLAGRLAPGQRLTITVTGLAEPVARGMDVRQRVVEQVLELAASAGVDDVVVLVANGIGPRPTDQQLHELLGERVVRSFLVEGRLRSHDVHDRDQLVEVAPGVELNARLAESDLVVDVSVAARDRVDPGRALVQNLSSLDTQRRFRDAADDDPRVLAAVAALPLVCVRAVLDQVAHPPALEFLGRREWEWTLRDRATWFGLRRLAALTPDQTRRSLLQAPADRGVVAVASGTAAAVAGWTAERLGEQETVPVDGQADVLVTGVPHRTPWNPDAAIDPLLAAWSALAGALGATTGTRAVRDGGVVIAFHPLRPAFSGRVHPSSADFFADVLSQTTDPAEMAGAEQRFADDDWYQNLYRHQHAHAGVLPFQLWAELTAARQGVEQVIWVGADRSAAERMGFRAATTLADALEIAADTVGRSPRIRYLHTPPGLVTDVRAG
ncbi:DUF2088 domain-containing protein [Auraticoccus sp. F435]|uniref:DUF2088 domain-containing protein n=1 Tax=Auraticoccus cholistanensis TaxID=2656650 RepID=A0A6A9UWG1_9ACTN|nr:lactate racemase domain-containing protein [Auraticoccus cholistanensis]MVA75962.1 DUF2088 domain-containing protein [Auraticoccus cholistanensis]